MERVGIRLRLETGGVRWRMVSGNGRVLAMSDIPFADDAEARAALDAVAGLAREDRLVPMLSHPRSSVTWAWIATAGDGTSAVVARGQRVYGRYGTCLAAFRRFVSFAASLDTDTLDTPATTTDTLDAAADSGTPSATPGAT